MKMLHVSMPRPLAGLIAALTVSLAMATGAQASTIARRRFAKLTPLNA